MPASTKLNASEVIVDVALGVGLFAICSAIQQLGGIFVAVGGIGFVVGIIALAGAGHPWGLIIVIGLNVISYVFGFAGCVAQLIPHG